MVLIVNVNVNVICVLVMHPSVVLIPVPTQRGVHYWRGRVPFLMTYILTWQARILLRFHFFLFSFVSADGTTLALDLIRGFNARIAYKGVDWKIELIHDLIDCNIWVIGWKELMHDCIDYDIWVIDWKELIHDFINYNIWVIDWKELIHDFIDYNMWVIDWKELIHDL